MNFFVAERPNHGRSKKSSPMLLSWALQHHDNLGWNPKLVALEIWTTATTIITVTTIRKQANTKMTKNGNGSTPS